MLHGSSSRYCFANFWDSFGKRCLYRSVCGMLDHESGPLQGILGTHQGSCYSLFYSLALLLLR